MNPPVVINAAAPRGTCTLLPPGDRRRAQWGIADHAGRVVAVLHPADTPRHMPTHRAIAARWAARCPPGADHVVACIDAGEPCCFACGWRDDRRGYGTGLERAHVVPRILGGPDHVDNLALLCRRCHEDSPDTADAVTFWRWVTECPHDRSPAGVAAARAREVMAMMSTDEIGQANALTTAETVALFAAVTDTVRPQLHHQRMSAGTVVAMYRAALRLHSDRDQHSLF